jgi:hypothetical protein
LSRTYNIEEDRCERIHNYFLHHRREEKKSVIVVVIVNDIKTVAGSWHVQGIDSTDSKDELFKIMTTNNGHSRHVSYWRL